jgi:DNA-binding beta-propeller fold protein YncE
MPPLALSLLFHHALPWLSGNGRAVLNTLICDNGRVGSAQALCQRLGLRSRFQLNRLLHREGLPPYEELAGWVCVFYWMLRADGGDGEGSLRALADHTHMEAASCYRLVRRVTGRCWRQLRRVGTTEVIGWFVKRARPPRLSRTIEIRHATREILPAPPPPAPRSPGDAAARWSSDQPRRVALSGGPYGIAVRGWDLAYITRAHAAAVERLDLTTGRLAGTIRLGCTPTCVAFAPSGMQAFVSVQYCDEIAVVDTSSHAQVGAIPVSGDPYPLLFSHRGRTLFVATNEDRLFGVCPQNGRVIGSLALPATSHHLALHPSGSRLYVATRSAGSVLEVDTMRYQVLRTFPLGGWPQGMVVSPDGTTLYVANEQRGLDVVRLASGKRVATLEFESGLVSLALSPDHRFLFTGLVHAGKVGAIAIPSLTVCGSLDTGGRPREIAFDNRGGVIVVNEAGWVDILPFDGQRIPRLERTADQPMAPLALSVS